MIRDLATVGETLTRFGERRLVVEVAADGVWFRQDGRLGFAPTRAWVRWFTGRR